MYVYVCMYMWVRGTESSPPPLIAQFTIEKVKKKTYKMKCFSCLKEHIMI